MRLKFRIANRFLGVYKSHNRHTASIIKFKIFFPHFCEGSFSASLSSFLFCLKLHSLSLSLSVSLSLFAFMFCAQFIEIYCIPLTEHACFAVALASPVAALASHPVAYTYCQGICIFTRLLTCARLECVTSESCACPTVPLSVLT